MNEHVQSVVQGLLDQAGPGRTILCQSMAEYFGNVARPMYELGLDRRGGGQRATVAGRQYIMDTWVLPDGTTIQAGYPG